VNKNSKKKPNRTTVTDYLNEIVNFGGLMVSRGEMIQELTKDAKASGHPNPQGLVNMYLAGHQRQEQLRKQEQRP
jgi:hypothetical protein